MTYISVVEASDKWKISARRIRVLCSEGRVEGAVKIGRSWSIPSDVTKPADGREGKRKMYLGMSYDFSHINKMKEQIDSYRPLSTNLSKSLHEKLVVEWTYNSNAIEGNTLTISETKVVLEGIFRLARCSRHLHDICQRTRGGPENCTPHGEHPGHSQIARRILEST